MAEDTITTRKVTFSLPVELVREVRQAVAEGLFPSQHALIREALTTLLMRLREERLRKAFEEAARDPLFLQDVRETEEAFATADAETARMIVDG